MQILFCFVNVLWTLLYVLYITLGNPIIIPTFTSEFYLFAQQENIVVPSLFPFRVHAVFFSLLWQTDEAQSSCQKC